MPGEEKKKGMFLDYIILANDENINRIQKAEHIFIDGKFNHPSHYKKLFITMYKQLIIDLKIPAFYILINGKKKIFYDYIFQSVYNILTENKKLDIIFKIITTNSEEALIKSFKIYFPNSLRITCYFRYIQDIIRLYKKEDKLSSNIIIKILSSLQIIYKGDLKLLIIYVKK